MAKKAVATLHEGSSDGRAYSKVIKMVKSQRRVLIFLMSRWFLMRTSKNSLRINSYKDINKEGCRLYSTTFFCLTLFTSLMNEKVRTT